VPKSIKIRDVLRRDPLKMSENLTLDRASRLMMRKGRGEALVSRRGKTVGIVTERDVLRLVAKGESPHEKLLGDIMRKHLITIDAAATLAEAVELMRKNGVRRVIVKEAGRIAGILTQGDIARMFWACNQCGKEIYGLATAPQEAPVECACGSIYHRDCASKVVYCTACSANLGFEVVYPEPKETMEG